MFVTLSLVLLFASTILGANWAIEEFGFVPVGFGLSAPAGVFFAGVAFVLRDLLHERSPRVTVLAILLGGCLSWFVSPAFAMASTVAFTASEFADYAVYAPIRRKSWLTAAFASNTVGLVVDSALFLWLAFGSLAFIEGQIVAKMYVTVGFVVVLWFARRVLAKRAEAA